jgi:hypothetical protein
MPAWSVPKDSTIHLPDGDREVMAVVPTADNRVSIYLKGRVDMGLVPKRVQYDRLSPVMVTENPVARAMADLVEADHRAESEGFTITCGRSGVGGPGPCKVTPL